MQSFRKKFINNVQPKWPLCHYRAYAMEGRSPTVTFFRYLGGKLMRRGCAVLAWFIGETKGNDGWWGLLGLVLVVGAAIASVVFSYYQLKRSGRQKRAEARLAWDRRYKEIVVELELILVHYEALMAPGRKAFAVRLSRMRREARGLATELLLMINPHGFDAASLIESTMEKELCTRLARLGISVDMKLCSSPQGRAQAELGAH